MPTQTFLNLPTPKRERILSAAITEFAGHVYADANLDRIALNSEVSKGSLFQYFEDKDDFYVHAVKCALDQAWQFYEEHIEACSPSDCFELLIETIMSMLALRKRRPDLASLYLRVVYAKDSHARDRMYEAFVERNNMFFEHLISWGIDTGHIDASLRADVVRFHLHAVGSHLTYLLLSDDDPRWLPRGAKRVREFVAETVGLLSHTLGHDAAETIKHA